MNKSVYLLVLVLYVSVFKVSGDSTLPSRDELVRRLESLKTSASDSLRQVGDQVKNLMPNISEANILETLQKAGDQVPDQVKNLLPGGEVGEEQVEQFESVLKSRCEQYGTNESFGRVMAARNDLQMCGQNFVNYTNLLEDIEKAKPTGDLDEVFRPYCRKTPHLRQCLANFTEALDSCLSPTERTTTSTILNITDALRGFICYKDGDRIALFIAEKGPECLKSKKTEIQNCLNSTFSKYIPSDLTNLQPASLPMLTITDKQCGDINTVQQCVVEHLEKCDEITPANIVDSLINYIRRFTPCPKKN